MTSLPKRIPRELFTEEQERLLEEANEAFHSYMTADYQCEKFLAYRKYEKASQAFIDSIVLSSCRPEWVGFAAGRDDDE